MSWILTRVLPILTWIAKFVVRVFALTFREGFLSARALTKYKLYCLIHNVKDGFDINKEEIGYLWVMKSSPKWFFCLMYKHLYLYLHFPSKLIKLYDWNTLLFFAPSIILTDHVIKTELHDDRVKLSDFSGRVNFGGDKL